MVLSRGPLLPGLLIVMPAVSVAALQLAGQGYTPAKPEVEKRLARAEGEEAAALEEAQQLLTE